MGLLVEEPLFPQLDIWGVGAASPHGASAYGPNGGAVNTHLEQALALDWPGIERVGSVWAHGNDSRLTAPDERRVRTAIAEAAAETGREGAVREAFLGGQAAIFRACKPVVGALEHWWNSYPEVPAMESAGYAAAALVVADRLEGEALDLALRPWRVLADGHPAGYFGSRTPQVDALLDAIPLLTLEQCDRVVATWARPRLPALQRWRAGAHLAPGEWWPADGPRPRLEKTLLETIGPDMRAERHLDEALASSWMRGGVPQDRWMHPFYGAWAHEAFKAAVAAEVAGDLLGPAASAELREAWEARDSNVSPEWIEIVVGASGSSLPTHRAQAHRPAPVVGQEHP